MKSAVKDQKFLQRLIVLHISQFLLKIWDSQCISRIVIFICKKYCSHPSRVTHFQIEIVEEQPREKTAALLRRMQRKISMKAYHFVQLNHPLVF